MSKKQKLGKSSPSPSPSSFSHFARGLAMGTADVIPGVSGGTIALITGIYPRLIAAIEAFHFKHALAFPQFLFFFYNRAKQKQAWNKIKELDWVFLIPLFGGLFCALASMVHVIPFFLENYTFYTYAFFCGLIIASIPIPLRQMRKKPS